jgi:hypothetical protein
MPEIHCEFVIAANVREVIGIYDGIAVAPTR